MKAGTFFHNPHTTNFRLAAPLFSFPNHVWNSPGLIAVPDGVPPIRRPPSFPTFFVDEVGFPFHPTSLYFTVVVPSRYWFSKIPLRPTFCTFSNCHFPPPSFFFSCGVEGRKGVIPVSSIWVTPVCPGFDCGVRFTGFYSIMLLGSIRCQPLPPPLLIALFQVLNSMSFFPEQ